MKKKKKKYTYIVKYKKIIYHYLKKNSFIWFTIIKYSCNANYILVFL